MPTILLVDDSNTDRILAAGLLQQVSGWQVVAVRGGREALIELSRRSFDIVVTDLVMPRMNGRQLVEAINGRHPEIPVIVMTSRGNEQIAVRALELGAASYVSKRSMAESLSHTVEQVMARSRQERAYRRVLERLETQRVHFDLRNNRDLFPSMVSYLRELMEAMGICHDAHLRNIGVAIEEVLLNAYYHGNLEVNSRPLENDRAEYIRIGAERHERHPYVDRKIHVTAEVLPAQATIVVCDDGPGFDTAQLQTVPGDRDFDRAKGRGLFLVERFTDRYSFNEEGNELTLIKRRVERKR